MKVSKGTTLNCEHTLARSILSLPSSPPHPPRPLLSLIFPPSSFIKKTGAHFPLLVLIMSTAATHPDPLPQRSIQDEDESVRIAVRALGDMRNRALLHSPPPHPPSASCAYLLPMFSVSIYSHPSPSSYSAYPGPLYRILLKLSNTHHPNPCVGGSRCGRRGNGPCCPCVDYPWCEHGPPGV